VEKWHVTIEALEPLSIAQQPNRESHWSTTSFITGSTWRGALAEIWKYKVGFEHTRTNQMFQEGIFKDAHMIGTGFYPCYVKELKGTNEKISILEEYRQEFPIEHNEKRLMEVFPFQNDVGFDQHVGISISDMRETVQHGQLYTMNAISQGTIFETTAYLDKEALQEVADDKKADDEYHVVTYVGKRKNVGFGKVEIRFKQINMEDELQNLQKRLETFSLNQDNQSELYIAFVNKSPLILRDCYLRYTSEIDWEQHILPFAAEPTVFEKLLAGGKITKELSWGTSHIRHGWNSAWNRPKQADWCVSPGSVQLFKIHDAEKLTDEVRDELRKLLVHIERFGLGERTSEGFGEIVVCPVVPLQQSDESELEMNEISDEMTVELLELAQTFAQGISKTKRLTTSQLFNLYSIDERKLVKEIIETDQTAYIQRRIDSRVNNGWKVEVEIDSVSQSIANHLRNIVNKWHTETNHYLETSRRTKKFLEYILGYLKIENGGEKNE